METKQIKGVQQTSLIALKEIMPKCGERQMEIIYVLKELISASNTQIAEFLERPINTITPRVNELRKLKIVAYSHTGLCPVTRRRVMIWKLNKEYRK